MTSNGKRIRSNVPTELLVMIQFEGTPALQGALRSLCREFIDIFSTAVRSLPAKVKPILIEIDRTKWELPGNRLPQRHHSAEKQAAIRIQVDALLKLGVIEESRATHWSQIHPVLKSPGKWRMTLDFVRLKIKCCDGRTRGLADSKHTTNNDEAGLPEPNDVCST